jgi:hypothetical protein
MSEIKNTKTFIAELVASFPEIIDDVLDENNLGFISLQIGCFRRFTQEAINGYDLNTVKKCIAFADANFETTEWEVTNSLSISFVGKLDFSKNRSAEKLLTDKLTGVRSQLDLYYNSLSKDEKLNKFLKDLGQDQS